MIICIGLIAYIMIYPVAEWSIDCPDANLNLQGNELCTEIKSIMWESVAMLSLYSSDGIYLTHIIFNDMQNIDEREYKSIIPMMVVMLSIIVASIKFDEKEQRNKSR